MSRLANLSLRNRALIALVTIFVMIFGALTAGQLKRELIPSISVPTAAISTGYSGASPQVVAQKVTKPIEQAVGSVSGIDTVTSTSSSGNSQVTVEMQYGTDMDAAQRHLEAAVSRIKSTLPDDADDPQVMTGDVNDLPVLQVSATNKSGNKSKLAQQLDQVAVHDLQKLDGVRKASVSGAPEPRVQVDLNHKKLTKKGLSTDDVSQALQSSGAESSAGSLHSTKHELSVNTGDRLKSAKQVRAVKLPTPKSKHGATIGDVATVKSTHARATSIARTNGKPSISLSVTKKPDGNTADVSKDVNNALPKIAKKMGDHTKFTTVFDQAPYINQSIHDLVIEGALGLGMAIVVILIFLLSGTSTVVTAVSIPVSVLITLIGLRVADYSLNMLTLGALTIAVGRIVDDSIVVIENIKRHLSYGESKITAITTAVREVATAITAATLTTVAVFLPITLVGGQVGELFRPFGATIGIALLASLLVSLTIIPVLAYWFLRPPKGRADPQVREHAEDRERRNPLQRGYVPILRATTKHPVVTIMVAVLVMGGTGMLASGLKTDFLGDSGENTLTVNQDFPPALSLKAKTKQAKKVEHAITKVDGVETVQTTVGGQADDAAMSGGDQDSASFMVTTDSDGDQERIQHDVGKRIDRLTGVSDVSLDKDAGMGGNSDVEAIVTAPDSHTLQRATDQVQHRLKKISGADNVSSSIASAQPLVHVDVDPVKAQRKGVSAAQVRQQLQGVLSPAKVATVETSTDDQDVVLKVADAPVSVHELRKTKISVPPAQSGGAGESGGSKQSGASKAGGAAGKTGKQGKSADSETGGSGQDKAGGAAGQQGAAGGQSQDSPGSDPSDAGKSKKVSLSSVADVSKTTVSPEVQQRDGQQSATVSLTPTGDNLSAVNTDVKDALDSLDLPSGADTELGGVSSDQADAFSQLGLALLVAVAIVFVVMVATFKSLIQPVILLVSVPFAAVGALLALVLTGTPLGVPALIGLLMLVGIVVTNAIVLIDLVNHYRAQGASVDEALIDGSRRRLRPILMTAVATIFALAPMALGVTGGGVFISQPLAIVVIGGLISSTLLTLILVPVLYRLIEGRRERKARRRAGDAATDGGPASTAADTAGPAAESSVDVMPEARTSEQAPQESAPSRTAPETPADQSRSGGPDVAQAGPDSGTGEGGRKRRRKPRRRGLFSRGRRRK